MFQSDDEEEDKEGASKENGKATQVTVAKDGKRAAAEPSAQPAQKRCDSSHSHLLDTRT